MLERGDKSAEEKRSGGKAKKAVATEGDEEDGEEGDAAAEDSDAGDGSGSEASHRLLARIDVPEALRKPGAIAEFSSNLSQRERTALLRKFRKAQVRCLVCSDVVARGIDIPEVSAVVNYSAPTHLQTYIHRVGRTARAGRTGHTFTFVKRTEMDRFETMLRGSADCWERIRRYPLPKEARDTTRPWYAEALTSLRKCFAEEEAGRLAASAPLQAEDVGLAEEGGHAAAADLKASPKAQPVVTQKKKRIKLTEVDDEDAEEEEVADEDDDLDELDELAGAVDDGEELEEPEADEVPSAGAAKAEKIGKARARDQEGAGGDGAAQDHSLLDYLRRRGRLVAPAR